MGDRKTDDPKTAVGGLKDQIRELQDHIRIIKSEKRELEDRLQQVQEQSWSAPWEFDLTSKEVVWSTNVYKMLNYPEDIEPDMGLFKSRLSPDAVDRLNGAIRKVFIEKAEYSFEHDLDQKNGIILNARTDLSISLNENGKPAKLHGVTRNITAIKTAQQQLEKLSMIASTTSNAAVSMDTHTNIQWVNNGFTLMTGYRIDEVQGKPLSNLLYPNKKRLGDEKSLYEHLSKEHVFQEELRLKTKRPKELWVLLNINPILDYELNPESYVVVMSDITLQKKSEQLLVSQKEMIERQRDDLEDKNKQLSKALMEVARAKIGRKALFITFLVGISLFMLSEIIVDPFVESYMERSGIFVLSTKLMIALMLKPIEDAVRRNLFRAEVKKRAEA